MSSAIDIRRADTGIVFDENSKRVIRDIYAKGANDSEFVALMAVASARGLDPRMGHCHFVKRWDSKERREVWSVQVSIDGLRTQAERTGDYDGQDEPEFEYDEKGTPRLARVRVYRKGISRPFVGVARWDEYVQKARDRETNAERPTRFWSAMPHTMLGKCAEALGIRKAFPADTAGLYTPEEMAQAENDRPEPRAVLVENVTLPPAQIAAPRDASALAAFVARVAEASSVERLRVVAKDAAKALPKGSQDRAEFERALHARRAEIEATAKPAPESGEQPVAWTRETWLAHINGHERAHGVAASFAKHMGEMGEALDACYVATCERLVDLGQTPAQAEALVKAACEKRGE